MELVGCRLVVLALALRSIFVASAARKWQLYDACEDPNNLLQTKHCTPLSKRGVSQAHYELHNQVVRKGEYRFFHWTLNDYALINGVNGSKVTFTVTPCHGAPVLYVKPAMLYDGRPMEQTFETMPGSNGLTTDTWPFPDNNTGAVLQGPERVTVDGKILVPDATRDYPGLYFQEMLWGFGAIKEAEINAITIDIQHGGYYISVFGVEESVFSISATTKPATPSPWAVAQASEDNIRLNVTGVSARTLQATGGTMIRVSWRTPDSAYDPVFAPSGYHVNDTYMVWWVADTRSLYKEPADGAELGHKVGCKNPPPYRDEQNPTAPPCDGNPAAYGAPQRLNGPAHCDLSDNVTARAACVMWTGCGMRAAAGHPDWTAFNISLNGTAGNNNATSQRTTAQAPPPASTPSAPVNNSWYRRFTDPRLAHNMADGRDPRTQARWTRGVEPFDHPVSITERHFAGDYWAFNHKVSENMGAAAWAGLNAQSSVMSVDLHVECAYAPPPASAGVTSYCSDHHYRSKMYYFAVLRVHGATGVEEVYTGVRGSTEFDKVTQAVANSTIIYVGVAAGGLLLLLAGCIIYTKMRTTMRLYRVYKHAELGDSPPDEEEEKAAAAAAEAKGEEGDEDDDDDDEEEGEEEEEADDAPNK